METGSAQQLSLLGLVLVLESGIWKSFLHGEAAEGRGLAPILEWGWTGGRPGQEAQHHAYLPRVVRPWAGQRPGLVEPQLPPSGVG